MRLRNETMRAVLMEADALLKQSEHARDHLRQQANVLKGICLALVRRLKDVSARLAFIEPGGTVDAAASVHGRPVLITKAEWDMLTGEDAKLGKGTVLSVIHVERDVMAAEPIHPDAEEGDILVDIGDVDAIEPAKVET
jgi:hypothetical protein